MTDTSSSHGFGSGGLHAVERGVDRGSAARACSTGDAGRGKPAGAVPAVRGPSEHRIQVAWAGGRQGKGDRSFAPPAFEAGAGRGLRWGARLWGGRGPPRPGGARRCAPALTRGGGP